MKVVSVSNAAQLSSALKAAKSGDVITLSGGDYGHLNLKNLHFAEDVTIKAATGIEASFSKVNLVNVTNVKFDGILFDQNEKSGGSRNFVFNQTKGVDIVNSTFDGTLKGGYGTGQGIWVVHSSDFTLENSVVRDFYTAAYFQNTTGLTIKDNLIEKAGLDGMIVGKVHEVLIEGNAIKLHVQSGKKHTDGIQFWNTGANEPSTNITIRDNLVGTNNSASHGIYMANGNAATHGKAAAFKNVLIEDNVVVSGQVSGIAWGRTDGLDISGNVLLQDASVKSTKVINTPAIRVESTSTDVEIKGNVTHVAPASSGRNWAPDKKANPSWTIEDNKIVKPGTRPEDVATSKPGTKPEPAPNQPVDTKPGDGNGEADTFRFDGPKGGSKTIKGVDFSEADQIKLIHFLDDTFDHIRGGNKIAVSLDGTYAAIDSVADLKELDAASDHVSIRETGEDSILITITQPGMAKHLIALTDMAQDYGADWGFL
jgi:hypothetical protein